MIKKIGMCNKDTREGFGNMYCRTQERAKEIVELVRKSKRWKGILDYNQDIEIDIKEISEEQYWNEWLEEFTKRTESELFNSFIKDLDKVYRRTFEGFPDVNHDGEVSLYLDKDFTKYLDGCLTYDKPICSLGEMIEDLKGNKIRITIEVIQLA